MSLIIDANAPDDGPAGGAAPGDLIKDSDTENFVTDVIEASRHVPVLVDFWATWCGPCKTLGPALEKVVTQMGGAVRLVKIDIDRNQDLAMQLRIQSVPTVYAFKDGQPVDGFQGAQPESQIKAFIERLTGGQGNPIDAALDKAQELLDAGRPAEAEEIYRQVLAEDRANTKAFAGVLRAFLALERTDEAKQLYDQLPANIQTDPAVAAVKTAMELAEAGGAAGDLAELRAKVDADPADHQARFDLAMAQYAAGDAEAAVDNLIESVRRDRDWDDGKAREQMIKIFEALGPADPVTVKGRRRLSSILFA